MESMKAVYTVVEREPNKKFWVRIGRAFTNRDGSLSVQLDAMPMNGRLEIREVVTMVVNGQERERELVATETVVEK